MKVLITGANGLVGQYLIPYLVNRNWDVLATSRGSSRLPDFPTVGAYRYSSLDITDGLAVHQMIQAYQPDVIIHAAAMTQVDTCELHQTAASEINVQGTAELLIEAESIGAHFIYLSTDFVFDGAAGPYREEDATSPVNWYGFTKLQAEAMVQESNCPWSIVRTCLVYGYPGAGRRNIISWVRDALLADKSIQVVKDQWRTPTYVFDLAMALEQIGLQKATGIWHVSGPDTFTPYAMAQETAAALGLSAVGIEPVTAATFKETGARPPRTGLVIDKAVQAGLYEPTPFMAGLVQTLQAFP
jgi:dTDP-4-dehydrorhamnose reductase